MSGLAKIDIPSAEDLLIRRLQGELSRRVEDNWQSINDPQRWQILNKDGKASSRILKSFTKLKEKMADLERDVNIKTVENMLIFKGFKAEKLSQIQSRGRPWTANGQSNK